MRSMRTRVALAFGALLLVNGVLHADFPGRSCRIGRNAGCLPNQPYGADARRSQITIQSFPAIEDKLVLQSSNRRLLPTGAPVQPLPARTIPPATGSILGEPGFKVTQDRLFQGPVAVNLPTQESLDPASAQAAPLIIRRKRFIAGAPPLQVGPVNVEQLGLAIYETGDIACNGIAYHNGGPEASLKGNHVEVGIRALSGTPGPDPLKPVGPIVWQKSHKLWLPRGKHEAISFVPCSNDSAVRLHFDEIVQLQINLEVIQDR